MAMTDDSGQRLGEKDYIEKRLEDQIQWYSGKSVICQKWYKRLKTIENILALSIAPLSFFAKECSFAQWLIAIIGVVISVMGFQQSLRKFHENWILYRSSCEILKQEKFLYLTRTGRYAVEGEEAFRVLVERCEHILAKEHNEWEVLHQSDVLAREADHLPAK